MADAQINHAGTGAASSGEEELLTLDEAVQFLGTSKPTLYRWLAQGEVRGLKVGKQWRFRKSDLVAYLERDPLAVATAPAEALDAELAFFAGELERVGAKLPEDAGDATDSKEGKLDRLIRQISLLAIASRASDIHLEPIRRGEEAYVWLRIRIDGVLHEIRRIPMILHEALMVRFKLMANMDPAERKLPQDGRFPFSYGSEHFVFYAATIPTAYGEALTVRIVVKADTLMSLEQIGIPAHHPLRNWIRQPNGVILCVGPRGSGKTTTLYGCIHEIAAPDRKTFLVEQQIEYTVPSTTALPINERAGMTRAAALRAIWRQDPDVILVDDLPDVETARMVPELALTGHLVLGQMQANTAVEAALRLVALGVEPLAVSISLLGIVAQRLVRKICPDCKEPALLASSSFLFAQAQQLAAAGGYEIPENATFYRGRGCDKCRHTGYRGRTALYEALEWNQALTEALLRRASAEELTDIAVAHGMRTLMADGARKAVEGMTTLDEVLRTVVVTV